MKRTRLNPRKLLIASAGVATANYVFAAGCGGKDGGNLYVVANLMPGPPYVGGFDGDAGPSVANLVAPPPVGSRGRAPVANSVARSPLPDAAAHADGSDAAEPGDAAADGG